MNAPLAVRTIFFLALTAFSADAATYSRVVVARGEQYLHKTAAPIATVSFPAAAQASMSKVVRFAEDQYGHNIALQGLAPGEATLLVESTAEQIAEVVHVVVVDKKVAAAFRQVADNIEAMRLSHAEVHLTPRVVLISGTVYSSAQHERCRSLAKQRNNPKVARVICGTRLNSTNSVVFSGAPVDPYASVAFSRKVGAGPADAVWTAEFRIGDVPAFVASSRNYAELVERVGSAVDRFNAAAAEWRNAARRSGLQYPFSARSLILPTGYSIALQWSPRQGTRGEQLIAFSADELRDPTARAQTSPDRLIEWWAAVTQDAARLYLAGSRPMKTGGADASPLMKLYRNALRLDAAPFEAANITPRLGRSYTALRWSAGRDPFAELLTAVPADFQSSGFAPTP